MNDLQQLPLSEILALAERCQAAEQQLAQIRAAVSGAAGAPHRPAPGRRTGPRRGAVPASHPVNANGKPMVACSVCNTADGTVRWKRCADCRKAGKGKPAGAKRGTGKKARATAATAPKAKGGRPRKLKVAPAPPVASKDEPRCDGAWMARVRMKFKENPAIEFLPGVQTVLKRCAANDWPLLAEVPAVIR